MAKIKQSKKTKEQTNKKPPEVPHQSGCDAESSFQSAGAVSKCHSAIRHLGGSWEKWQEMNEARRKERFTRGKKAVELDSKWRQLQLQVAMGGWLANIRSEEVSQIGLWGRRLSSSGWLASKASRNTTPNSVCCWRKVPPLPLLSVSLCAASHPLSALWLTTPLVVFGGLFVEFSVGFVFYYNVLSPFLSGNLLAVERMCSGWLPAAMGWPCLWGSLEVAQHSLWVERNPV